MDQLTEKNLQKFDKDNLKASEENMQISQSDEEAKNQINFEQPQVEKASKKQNIQHNLFMLKYSIQKQLLQKEQQKLIETLSDMLIEQKCIKDEIIEYEHQKNRLQNELFDQQIQLTNYKQQIYQNILNQQNKQLHFNNMQYDKLVRSGKNFKHPLFGMAAIQKNPNTKELFLKKTIKAKNAKELSNTIAIIQQRIDIQSENILKILDLDIDFENLQVHILFQYPDVTLNQRISQLKKNFKEKQQFIENILKGLADLQKSDMVHGHLSIDSIYYNQKTKQYQLIDKFLLEGVKNFDYLLKLKKSDKIYISPEVTSYIGRKLQSLPFNPLTQDVFSLGMLFLEIVSSEKHLQQCYSIKQKQFSIEKLENLKKTIVEKYSKQPKFKTLFKFVENYLLQYNTLDRAFPSQSLSAFQKYLQTDIFETNTLVSIPKEFEISKIHYIGNYFLNIQDKLKINYDQQPSLRQTKSEKKFSQNQNDISPYNVMVTAPNFQQLDIEELQDRLGKKTSFRKSKSRTSIGRNSSANSRDKKPFQHELTQKSKNTSKSKDKPQKFLNLQEEPKQSSYRRKSKHNVRKRKSIIVLDSEKKDFSNNLVNKKSFDTEEEIQTEKPFKQTSRQRKQSIRQVESNEKMELLQKNKGLTLHPNSNIYEQMTEIEEVDGDQVVKRTRRNTIQQQDFDIVEEEIEEESLNTSLFMERLDENSQEVQDFLKQRNIKLEKNQTVYRVEGILQIVENQDMEVQMNQDSSKVFEDINKIVNKTIERQTSEQLQIQVENMQIKKLQSIPNISQIKQNDKEKDQKQTFDNDFENLDFKKDNIIQEQFIAEQETEKNLHKIDQLQIQDQKQRQKIENQPEDLEQDADSKNFYTDIDQNKQSQQKDEQQKYNTSDLQTMENQIQDTQQSNNFTQTLQKSGKQQVPLQQKENEFIQEENINQQNEEYNQAQPTNISINEKNVQKQEQIQKEEKKLYSQKLQNQDEINKNKKLETEKQNNQQEKKQKVLDLDLQKEVQQISEDQYNKQTNNQKNLKDEQPHFNIQDKKYINEKQHIIQENKKAKDTEQSKHQQTNTNIGSMKFHEDEYQNIKKKSSKKKNKRKNQSNFILQSFIEEFQQSALQLFEEKQEEVSTQQKNKQKESQSLQQDNQEQTHVQQRDINLNFTQKNIENQNFDSEVLEDQNNVNEVVLEQQQNEVKEKSENQQHIQNQVEEIYNQYPNESENNQTTNNDEQLLEDDNQLLSMLIQKNEENQQVELFDENIEKYTADIYIDDEVNQQCPQNDVFQQKPFDNEYSSQTNKFSDSYAQEIIIDDQDNNEGLKQEQDLKEDEQQKQNIEISTNMQTNINQGIQKDEIPAINDEIKLNSTNNQQDLFEENETNAKFLQQEVELRQYPKYFMNYDVEKKYSYLKRKKRGSRRIKAVSTKDITKNLQSFAYPNQEDLFKKFSSTRHVKIPVFKKKDTPVSIDSQITDKINENIFERAFDMEIEKKQNQSQAKPEEKVQQKIEEVVSQPSNQSIGTQTEIIDQIDICQNCQQNISKNKNHQFLDQFNTAKKKQDQLAQQLIDNFRTNQFKRQNKNYHIDGNFLIYVNQSDNFENTLKKQHKRIQRDIKNFMEIINQNVVKGLQQPYKETLQTNINEKDIIGNNLRESFSFRICENQNSIKKELQIVKNQSQNLQKKQKKQYNSLNSNYKQLIHLKKGPKNLEISKKHQIVRKEKQKCSLATQLTQFFFIPSQTDIKFFNWNLQNIYQETYNNQINATQNKIEMTKNHIKTSFQVSQVYRVISQSAKIKNERSYKIQKMPIYISQNSIYEDQDMQKIMQQQDEIYRQLKMDQSFPAFQENQQSEIDPSQKQFYFEDKELEKDLLKRKISNKIEQFKIFANSKHDSFSECDEYDEDYFNDDDKNNKMHYKKNKLFFDEAQIKKKNKNQEKQFYKSQTLKFKNPDSKEITINFLNDDMSVLTKDPELRQMINLIQKHQTKKHLKISENFSLLNQIVHQPKNKQKKTQQNEFDFAYYFCFQKFKKHTKLSNQNFVQFLKYRQEIRDIQNQTTQTNETDNQVIQNNDLQIQVNHATLYQQGTEAQPKQQKQVSQNYQYQYDKNQNISNQNDTQNQGIILKQSKQYNIQKKDNSYLIFEFDVYKQQKHKKTSKIKYLYTYSNQQITVQQSKSSSHSNQHIENKICNMQNTKNLNRSIPKKSYYFIKPKYTVFKDIKKNYQYQQSFKQKDYESKPFRILERVQTDQEQRNPQNYYIQKVYQKRFESQKDILSNKSEKHQQNFQILQKHKEKIQKQIQGYELLKKYKFEVNQKMKPSNDNQVLEDYMILLNGKSYCIDENIVNSFTPKTKTRFLNQQKVFTNYIEDAQNRQDKSEEKNCKNNLEDFIVFVKVKQNKNNNHMQVKDFTPRRKSRLFNQQKIFKQMFEHIQLPDQSSVSMLEQEESKKNSINQIQEIEIYQKNKKEHSLTQDKNYEKMFKKSKTQQDVIQFKNYLIKHKKLRLNELQQNYEFSMTSSKNQSLSNFDINIQNKKEDKYPISKIIKILEQDNEGLSQRQSDKRSNLIYSKNYAFNIEKKEKLEGQKESCSSINLYENDNGTISFEQMLQQFQDYSNFISSQSSVLINRMKESKNSICHECKSILDAPTSQKSYSNQFYQKSHFEKAKKDENYIQIESQQQKQKKQFQIKKNYNFIGYLDLNPSEPSSMTNIHNFLFVQKKQQLQDNKSSQNSGIEQIFRHRKISDTQQIFNKSKEINTNKQIKTKVNPIKRPTIDKRYNLYNDFPIKNKDVSPKPNLPFMGQQSNKKRNKSNIQSEKIYQNEIKQNYSPITKGKRSLRNSLKQQFKKQNTAITDANIQRKFMNRTHDLFFDQKYKDSQGSNKLDQQKYNFYDKNVFKKQLNF